MKLKQRKVPVLADAVILVASKKFDVKQSEKSMLQNVKRNEAKKLKRNEAKGSE